MRDLAASYAGKLLVCAALFACGADSDEHVSDGGDAGEAAPRRVLRPGQTPSAEGDAGRIDGPSDAGTGEVPDASADPDAGGLSPLPCDVAGVLRNHCVQCHRQPPLMGAPLSLLSWEDLDAPWGMDAKVRDVVLQRVTATSNRMPPRPNEPLSQAQIDALRRWVEAGAPKGDNASCGFP